MYILIKLATNCRTRKIRTIRVMAEAARPLRAMWADWASNKSVPVKVQLELWHFLVLAMVDLALNMSLPVKQYTTSGMIETVATICHHSGCQRYL